MLKTQSGRVLQKHRASACTYHIVKSHPVPRGHVTFKNATVNDSTVHGNRPLMRRGRFHIREQHQAFCFPVC